ncbi:MAG: succinylglutamate desuccinylase/aspartoacylase family protein [Methanobacteriaceae archaeon]|nr:succinylglutamate desuccinylase/aspartoacylase family protein [Methanobacteriaceae archaeon]
MFKRFRFLMFIIFILFISIASVSASDVDLNNDFSLNDAAINDDNNSVDNNGTNEDVVLKDSTTLKTSDVKGYLTTSTYVSAILMDSNGSVIPNKTVLISVTKGKTYKVVTDNNGVAKVKIPTKKGTFSVVFKFVGDDDYYGSSAKSKVVISKMKTKLVVPVVKSHIKKSTYLYVTLKDNNGKVLSKKKVTVKIKGKYYKLTTNNKGVAKLKITSKLGTYKVSVKYAGSSNYVASSASSKVVITKVPTSIVAPAISYDSTKYGYLTVTLKDNNKKVLKNKVVYVYISSLKKTYKLKTNSKGVAKLKFHSLKNYSCTVKFKGDKTYLASSVSSKLNVKLVKFSVNDVVNSSSTVKDYVLKYSKLPSKVSVNGVSCTDAQFTYLMASAINNINNGNYNDITLSIINAPASPNGGFFYKNISQSYYLKLSTNLVSYVNKNSKLPNYVSLSSSNKVDYNLCSYVFSDILASYMVDGQLPSKISLDSSLFINKPNGDYALTCLNWGSGGDITKNKVLMKNIKRTTLANKIIAMCKKGTPIIAFGDGDGPTVIINSGVHGNELSSQAASFKLIEKLYSIRSSIKGTIYVIPVLSPRSTAKNVRDYNGIKLNSIANKEGTISNNLIQLSLAVGAEGLGDFHCSKHGGDPGKNVAMGSYNPNGDSAVLAKYIASNAKVASKIYKLAGSSYPGAIEDEANIHGITSVTCEVLTNQGTIEKGTVNLSYNMMLYFLKYFGIID